MSAYEFRIWLAVLFLGGIATVMYMAWFLTAALIR